MFLLKKFLFTLKFTLKAIPLWFFYTIANNILGVLCNILGSVMLINVVLTGISDGNDFSIIIMPVLIIQTIIVCGAICTSIYYGKVDPISRQKLSKKITYELVDNAFKTETSNIDNPEYLNEYNFVLGNAEKVTTGSVYILSNLLSNIFGLIFSIMIVGFINVEIIGLILVVMVVSLLISNILTKIKFKQDKEIVFSNRQKNYVERTYYMKKFALEIRTYPVSRCLTKIYDDGIKGAIKVIKKYGFKTSVLSFLKSYIQEIILYWGAMSIILIGLFDGNINISPANVIPMTVAVCGMSGYLISLLGTINSIKENDLYSDKIFRFMQCGSNNRQKKKCIKINNDFPTIKFNEVSFKYEKEAAFAIKKINLELLPGEKIAIVGANGSGKSTIIKLLLGLYENYSGDITIEDKKITEYSMQEYRNLFSVVQQDFQQYPCSIAENVLMDEVSANDVKRIKKSLEDVELELMLSDEDITNRDITSEFSSNGITLSKGQYQKIALARIFASDKKVIILDEPTSSLDPISEYKIFNHLLDRFNDKTIVIISHRLTATKNADKIYLIENGEIVESGTHRQLMDQNGKYKEMYSMQANKYI